MALIDLQFGQWAIGSVPFWSRPHFYQMPDDAPDRWTFFIGPCEKKFHQLGIARHRAMHRDRREFCEIELSDGYVREYNFQITLTIDDIQVTEEKEDQR